MTEFKIGDVVEGRFSARPERTERAIVRGIITDQFHGDCIDYEPHFGYGTWGYNTEVESVRPSTQEDERAAAEVKARVHSDTAHLLR